MTETTLPVEVEKDTGPKLGIFDDISNNSYHRGPGISKSGLDKIRQSPELFITARKYPQPATKAMIFGQQLHSLVLEPDKFELEYVMQPEGAPNRPTKAQLASAKPTPKAQAAIEYWQQWDEENKGKEIISTTPTDPDNPFWKASDWCMLHRMRDAVMMHPVAGILLSPADGKAEQSAYWVDKFGDDPTYKLCKCRTDWFSEPHNVVVDLKSTLDASYTGFTKSVHNFRYHVQDAFYTDGLYQAGRKIDAFIFVAVEKQPPYGVGIYVLDKETKRTGRMQYQADLALYAECKESGIWPAYPPEIRELQLSPWQLRGNIR